MNFLWPIFVVISANVLYNIVAKSTPHDVQPFATLTVTYLTAAIITFILFLATGGDKNIINEIRKVNWTSGAFALAIVGLEIGYIYVYRAGWKISTGSLVANIGLACMLLFIGVIFYKESISVRHILGMIMCAGGLLLITK